jgi:hypothetical protein
MINFKVGNILESEADALVNIVNCEGFMGKGIAYQFKIKFPNNNQEYIDACKKGKFKIRNILQYYPELRSLVKCKFNNFKPINILST